MDRSNRRQSSRFSVALTALALLATPSLAEPVGFVAGIEGRVEIQPLGETSFAAARVDDEIEIGDVVRTGLDSAVKIVLVDDTTLSLGEDTEIAIDSFVVGEAATREPSILRQLKGQIRTRVGEAFGGTTRVEIHTPTAVMGVKGTELTSKIEDLGAEAVSLCCNWEGGVFMFLPSDGIQVDIPLNFCRRAWIDRIGPPIPVPDDFVPVKSPSQKMGPKAIQAMLFGSGDSGLLDDWLSARGLPPVGEPPIIITMEPDRLVPAPPYDSDTNPVSDPPSPPVVPILPTIDFPPIGGGDPGQGQPGGGDQEAG